MQDHRSSKGQPMKAPLLLALAGLSISTALAAKGVMSAFINCRHAIE
jgi:hypothetical protein